MISGHGDEMLIAGCDPSLRNFGIVIAEVDVRTFDFQIKEMFLIESEADTKNKKVVRKNSDDLRRAKILHDGFVEACRKPVKVFVEVPVGSQSARAMASYGICIGVLASCPNHVIQVTPTEVKLAMTGKKTATKGEMIAAAVKAHPNAPWLKRKAHGKEEMLADNEHLADAIGAIMAGLKTDQFQGEVATARLMSEGINDH
jgi:Holliday junction resolvasome RuvABC endonuclease subunit